MRTSVGLLLLGLATLVLPGPRPGRRLSRLALGATATEPRPTSRLRGPVLAAVAGLVLAVAVGGVGGLVVGVLGGGVAARALTGADGHGSRRTRQRREAALPGVLDLLGVCLDSGLPPGAALALVAPGTAPALRGDLASVRGLYELGADPTTAWAEWRTDPVLGPVARVMARSGHSGSTLASALRGLSTQVRADAESRAESAARRAGVFVLAPLGLCFLPAFVCLGVVPTVVGIASTVFP